jgi:hypothetical protein
VGFVAFSCRLRTSIRIRRRTPLFRPSPHRACSGRYGENLVSSPPMTKVVLIGFALAVAGAGCNGSGDDDATGGTGATGGTTQQGGSSGAGGGTAISGTGGTASGGKATGGSSGGPTSGAGGSAARGGSGGTGAVSGSAGSPAVPVANGSMGVVPIHCSMTAGDCTGTACCRDPLSYSCVAAFSDCECSVMGRCTAIACEKNADCAAGSKCCALHNTLTAPGYVASSCKTACDSNESQVCTSNTDCGADEACQSTSVTFSICF